MKRFRTKNVLAGILLLTMLSGSQSFAQENIEEKTAIPEQVQQMIEAVAAVEPGEALAVLLDNSWTDADAERTDADILEYQMETEEISANFLSLSDREGHRYTAIRCVSGKTRNLYYLEAGPDAIRYLITGILDDIYQGPFVSQTLYPEEEHFVAAAGTITAEGLVTGNLEVFLSDPEPEETEKEAEAEADTDTDAQRLLSLWNNRYLAGMTYRGTLDSEGRTTLETPGEWAKEGRLCYAAQERGGEMTYLYLEEDPEYVFTGESFGVYTIWDQE